MCERWSVEPMGEERMWLVNELIEQIILGWFRHNYSKDNQ